MGIRTRTLIGLALCVVSCLATTKAFTQTVIINEVHYHPGDGSSSGEFVE